MFGDGAGAVVLRAGGGRRARGDSARSTWCSDRRGPRT
ncbi:hypothetical protein [Actinoplanes nipponensis]